MLETASSLMRTVVTRFEVWDPALSALVPLLPGSVLRNLRIVFDRRVGHGTTSARWAVEFLVDGDLYRAAFERVMENTSPPFAAGMGPS